MRVVIDDPHDKAGIGQAGRDWMLTFHSADRIVELQLEADALVRLAAWWQFTRPPASRCGNEIGRYAFVGAGAVITQRVPDYALMVGIPARRIGWMSRAGERLGPALTCSRDGSRYREKVDGSLEYIDAEP